MDHAEVRAWLEEAFFRPGALRRLDEEVAAETAREESDEAVVRAHLRECSACLHELRALRATGVALDAGLGPSPAARERTLARVRQVGRARGSVAPDVPPAGDAPAASAEPSPQRRSSARAMPLRWAAALLVALVAFGSGALLGLSWPGEATQEGPQLEHAAVVMGELMSERDSRQIRLLDTSNAPAGLVVHSVARQQLAVMSSALEPPSSGRYECYLERDGERTLIGPMHFDGDTAFWAGPVGGPPDAGRSGDRFLVMLGDGSDVVLWGQF